MPLLDDTALPSDDEGQVHGFQINEKFAEGYNERKRRQELGRAREMGLLDEGDSESSSSESEDEGDIPLATDVKIMNMLDMIKRRDPKLYQENKTFFDETSSSTESGTEELGEKKHKPMRARDVMREQILEADREGRENAFDESDDEDEVPSNAEQLKGKVYDAEQAALRKQFLQSASAAEDKAVEDGFLQVKEKSDAQRAAEARDLKNLLQDQAMDAGVDEAARQAAANFVRNKPQDEGEAFLHDFLVKRKWREEEDSDGAVDQLLADVEADEEAVERADEFEAKYNFRFEEEGGDQITSFARTIEGSVRRKESKRAQQREARKQRKAEEKKQHQEEIKRLKDMKRQEFSKQLREIIEASGSKMTEEDLYARLMKAGIDLDGEFDPEMWDKAMQIVFDDNYYAEPDDELMQDDENRSTWAEINDDMEADIHEARKLNSSVASNAPTDKSLQASDHTSDSDSENDSESDTAEETNAASVPSEDQLKASLDRAKAIHSQVSKLGFEDIIGGMKTKFKYRSVPANTWGLSTDDILQADDRELNQFVSLKKLAPYREQEWFLPSKLRSTKVKSFRTKLAARSQELERAAEKEKREIRRDKRKRKKQKNAEQQEVAQNAQANEALDSTTQSTKSKQKSHSKESNKSEETRSTKSTAKTLQLKSGDTMRTSRLASYGMDVVDAVAVPRKSSNKKRRRRGKNKADKHDNDSAKKARAD